VILRIISIILNTVLVGHVSCTGLHVFQQSIPHLKRKDTIFYFNLATLVLSRLCEAMPRPSIASPNIPMPKSIFSDKKGSIPLTGYGVEVT
jgi:hypothetical protein